MLISLKWRAVAEFDYLKESPDRSDRLRTSVNSVSPEVGARNDHAEGEIIYTREWLGKSSVQGFQSNPQNVS